MTERLSPDFIAELARYAELPLDADRAVALSEVLGPALRKLRAIRPDGYEMLSPGLSFRVPLPPDEGQA